MSALSNIEESKSPARKTPTTIMGMLADPAFKQQLAVAIPKHLTPERMSRVVMTEIRNTPKLLECELPSLVGAIMKASQLGLEVGSGLGQCYLIPFKKECQFIIGYKGLIQLAMNSGKVKSIWSKIVYDNDHFVYKEGLQPDIDHEPNLRDPGEMYAVYCVAEMTSGGKIFEVMSRNEVEKIRQGSQGKNATPWTKHFEEMARKTCFRRLSKWLPLSPESADAVYQDEAGDRGEQHNSSWYRGGETIDGEATDVTGNPNAKAPEKKAERKPRKTRAQTEAEKGPAARSPAPVVQDNEKVPAGDAAGAEPAKEEKDGESVTYAQVAQGINNAPDEKQSQAWLNTARGQLPADQIAELVQLHLDKWKAQNGG